MTDFYVLFPELVLISTVVGLIFSESAYANESYRFSFWIALFGLVISSLQLFLFPVQGEYTFLDGRWAADGMAIFGKLSAFILVGLMILHQRLNHPEHSKGSERFSLWIGVALVLSMAASSLDLMITYLLIQLFFVVAISITGFDRKKIRSSEASIKIWIYFLASSVFYLIGSILLYRFTGSFEYPEIYAYLQNHQLPERSALFIFFCFFCSLSVLIASFPMYFWLPDAVEGCPRESVPVILLALPMMGLFLLMRLLLWVFTRPGLSVGNWVSFGEFDWSLWVASSAVLSLAVGGFLSVGQVRMYRLLGTFGVAHSGFLLLGLMVSNRMGVGALLYELLCYLIAMIGILFSFDRIYIVTGSDRFADLKQTLNRQPFEALCLLLFFSSLIGLPPFAGFSSRFAILGATYEDHWPVLAFLSVFLGLILWIPFGKVTYAMVSGFSSSSASRGRSNNFGQIPLILLLSLFAVVSYFSDEIIQWTSSSMPMILW